ncbi:transcription factor [Fusarium langsethiae]|uniref:Transcription factor n=1 Tax=Fusarium langsethiae TaxID=179993 RepID=A0A0N0DAT9_FUSLA|nr:transcription factor [Fusarium langsethiae]
MRPSVNDAHSEPVFAYFVLWIETARCQGNIYEMLYSPNSMTQPDQVKQSRVEALLSDLRSLETTTLETNTIWLEEVRKSSGEDIINFFYVSDNVLRLPPGSATTFNSDCITAARATLEKHEECIALIQRSVAPYLTIYIHWTLLFAPFIPLIVIFCHVIETQNESDLARLQAFVMSIQSATSISSPAARLHRLFQTLCKIALSYVKFRTSAAPANNWQDASKIDGYLDALGFSSSSGGNPSRHHNMFAQHDSMGDNVVIESRNAGTSAEGMGDEFRVVNLMMWMGNSMELEERLENSEVMTGFI